MTTDVLALREALLRDIHTTFCERPAVAMRKYTPQVTAHQVEGMVADRLTALIEQARQDGAAEARAGMVSVEALAEAIHRGCERRWDEMGRLDPDLAITMHYADAHLRFAAAIVEDLAALAATPPAPADVRPCLDCGAPVLMTDVGANHLGDRLDNTHTPHVALWNQLHPATLPTPVLTAARLAALEELVGELVVDYHQTGSIRDHVDPNAKGWEVNKDWRICEDVLCEAARQLLATPAPEVERVPLPEGHRWCDACSGQGVFRIETPPEPSTPEKAP